MMAKLSSARSCGHWSIGKAPTNEEARKPWFSKIGRKSRVRIIHKCLGMPMKYHGSGEPPLTVTGGILLTLDSGLLFLGWEWTWGALKSGIGLEMSFTTSGTVFDSMTCWSRTDPWNTVSTIQTQFGLRDGFRWPSWCLPSQFLLLLRTSRLSSWSWRTCLCPRFRNSWMPTLKAMSSTG